jgi:peptidoglycan hydrolase-like protein with peptidoglycan-binding domain
MTNNADVKALQQALNLEKVYNGPINGNFRSLTRQAVIDFQKKHNFANIPNTGYVGSYTRQVLNSLYSK